MGLAIAFSGTSLIVMRRGGLSVEEFSGGEHAIVLLSAMLLGFRLILSAQMVRQTEPTRVVVWMMILALWAFMLGGLIFEEIRWENLDWPPLSEFSTRGGDRRIRVHGDGTALQILQPDPGFQLRFHFPGLRRAVIRLAAP